MWARDFLLKGLRRGIGSRAHSLVFGSPWLPCPVLFWPISLPMEGSETMVVGELMNEGGRWNVPLLRRVFWEVYVGVFLQFQFLLLQDQMCGFGIIL